jgi:hypothetical protein
LKTKHRAGGTGQHYSPAGCAGPRGGPEHPEGAGAPDLVLVYLPRAGIPLAIALTRDPRSYRPAPNERSASDCVSGGPNFYLKPVNTNTCSNCVQVRDP